MRRLIQTISFKNFASMQYEAEKGSLLIDVFIDEIIVLTAKPSWRLLE